MANACGAFGRGRAFGSGICSSSFTTAPSEVASGSPPCGVCPAAAESSRASADCIRRRRGGVTGARSDIRGARPSREEAEGAARPRDDEEAPRRSSEELQAENGYG